MEGTDLGSVNYGVVTDRNIVADNGHAALVERVDARVVLDVDAVADLDGVHITAQNHSIPDAAIIADGYIADDHSILCNEAILSDLRGKTSQGTDDCHGPV